jgi:tetratricopeptide (TPR) repeat protein
MASGGGGAVSWVALAAATAAIGVAVFAGGPRSAKEPADEDADLLDAKSLENRLHDAETRLEAAEKRLQEALDRLDRAEKAPREAGPGGAGGTGTGAAPPTAVGPDAPGTPEDAAKKAEAEDLLRSIREGRLPEDGVFAAFTKAKDLGVLDEALAEMEKYAAAHADDPDAQVDLAGAYIVKLMQVPDGMERGTWSAKSIAACEAALKIDPEHWGGQFTKAMNLSQWPAFLGKQPEAIRTFEKLVEQQERSPSDPRFAQTYYQLGNTYRTAGNVEKAKEVFRRGLERFPDNRPLKEQLDLLDKR